MFHEQTLDGIGTREIVIGVEGREDSPAAHPLKPADQMATEKSGAAGDYDALVRETYHQDLPSAAMAN
jgi:hypothetical protein